MKVKLKAAQALRIAELERKLVEANGQHAYVYAYASDAVEKASTDHLTASGVVLTLTALGGREIVKPVVIRDGLSAETIAAIRKDLRRSYDLAVKLVPKEPS